MNEALLQELLDAGTPAMLVVKVAAEMSRLAAEAEALERRRRADRERQQDRREAAKVGNVMSRDVADVADTADGTPSLDKSPPDPQKLIPTPHTHGERASAREAAPKLWACPDSVEPAHWRDFLGNRRRKKLGTSETAYLGQLKLIERFANDEWPPGRLVEHAAEKGWGTIVNPLEYETPRNGQRTPNPRSGGSRNGLFDASVRWALGEPDPHDDQRTVAHR